MPLKFAIWMAAALFAMPAAVPAAAEKPPVLKTYKTAGSAELKVHIFGHEAAARSRAAVLLFHGGGWTHGEADWVHAAARILQREGLVAIAVTYRLSGEGITPADALDDACDAFAWARDNAKSLGIDSGRVAGYGVSAGGQLVAAAGLGACGVGRKGPDLMLLWSPALDLERDGWFKRLLGGKDPAHFSPVALAVHKGPPVAIVQGDKDTLTPLAGAERFCTRLRAAGGQCELYRYPGLGHLLTRNLANQESDFDVDPNADKDGDARLNAFLRAHGYTSAY